MSDKRLIETLRAIQIENSQLAVAGAAGRAADRIEADAERIARLEKARDELLSVATEFCDRVERGEIRSRKTYAAFKAAIAGSGDALARRDARVAADVWSRARKMLPVSMSLQSDFLRIEKRLRREAEGGAS